MGGAVKAEVVAGWRGECLPGTGTVGQVFCMGNCASMGAGVRGIRRIV